MAQDSQRSESSSTIIPCLNRFDESWNETWYCLHTKSRREKCVARDCKQFEIPHFLPLRKSIKRHNGRNYIFDVPLFSGYLFCAASKEQYYSLMKTNNMANFLEVKDKESLLNDLKHINLAFEKDVPVEPFPFLRRGRLVRIIRGPLMGLEGVLSERKQKFRVVLNVRMLNQAVAVEVDCEIVKAV